MTSKRVNDTFLNVMNEPEPLPTQPRGEVRPEPLEPEGQLVKDPQTLTPEEQMALYEASLKESDWGHQPC